MKEVILLLACVAAVYGLGDKCDNCLPKPQLHVYERRACKPFMSPECGCPMYYDCPAEVVALPLPEPEKLKLKTLGEKACIFDDKVYAIEEQLQTHCRVCHCRATETARNVSGHMLKGDPFGPCADIECPEMFNGFLAPGCHRTYSPDKCCSTGKICAGHEKAAFQCKVGETKYGFGGKIFMDKEPCKTCLCDEKFDENNLDRSTCWEQRCNLGRETDKDVFMQHCTPVYFKKSCCHNGFICAKDFKPDAASFEARPTKLTDTCMLRGKSYKIGEKMNFKTEDTYSQGFTGGECTCQVPPLMTCYYSA